MSTDTQSGKDAYWKAVLGLLTKILILWFWCLTGPELYS